MTRPGTTRLLLYLAHAQGLVRRYFVVNGFDGALAMLGLLTGFRLSGHVGLAVVVAACVGTSVALGISGLTSAYLSESAERRRALSDLEQAMLTPLSDSEHGVAARLLPWLIALVNGAAPVAMALLIMIPLWLGLAGVPLPLAPLTLAIVVAFACIFGLGVFLGSVGGTHWLGSGLKALLIAVATVLIILLVGH
jgi:predicted membrane protein (TIGR00267 family)